MRFALFAAVALAASGCAHSQVAAPAGAQAQDVAGVRVAAPAGFRINLFAGDLGQTRFMAFDPRGRLMVCDMRGGRVLTLPDENRDGRADRTIVFADGLDLPHSIAWREGKAYVAGDGRVIQFTDADGDGIADRSRAIIDNLPRGGGHITRTIVFSRDGKYMFVSVGSSSNVTPEQDPHRAAILRFDPDGSHPMIFATGLRNAVGLAIDPANGALWATDNGRDRLGENLPPDELDIIRENGFYGWPWYYGDNLPDPEFSQRPPPGIPPALEFQAHSAPLGLCFYTGEMFPQEYRGDVFVCFHGSWNRRVPTGYKVVRVRVKDNRPVSYEDFVTGFLTPDGVTGRPVDVKVGPDGALYFSDDKGGRIYRVAAE
jgi:glucose/arabinose dehydrogenase